MALDTLSDPLLCVAPSFESLEPDLVASLLRCACTALRASQGGIALVSRDGTPTQHVTYRPTERPTAAVSPIWVAELAQRLHREPHLLRDDPAAAALVAGPFLALPLSSHDRNWAILYVRRESDAPAFDSVDEEVLLGMCGLVKPEVLSEEGHRLARQRLLTQVARAAAGSLDLGGLCTSALHELDRLVPLSIIAVWLAPADDPERGSARPYLRIAALSDTRPEHGESLGLTVGDSIGDEEPELMRCLQGEPLYADLDRPGAGGPLAKRLALAGATSSFVVPLRTGDRCLGGLHAISFRPSGLTSEQIQLCHLTADLLGPAISNCQLYDRLRAAYEDLRLTQQRLVTAEKMRALGELAGGMAHEFNNALCSTLGFLEIALRTSPLEADIRRDIEAARACAWDAARIVRRVQDFARQRSEESRRSRLDINELVRHTLQVARLRSDTTPSVGMIAFELDLESALVPHVHGDATELRQVVTNLIFNAIDAMPDGGTLTLRTRTTRDRVLLEVQDTGVGIPLKIQHRLFEPFFTTKGERGNGLGLSVVYGIVQRHGGAIDVESRPGHGATITVQFPALTFSRPASDLALHR